MPTRAKSHETRCYNLADITVAGKYVKADNCMNDNLAASFLFLTFQC